MDNKILLQDITEFLCRRSDITQREAEQFVRSFFEVIQQGLERDQYVKIKGFGTFKLVEVGQRESVNIKTGERFQINGHTKVSFTPDNSLKDLVNRPFAHFQTVILNDETAIEELEACTTPEDFEQPNEEEPLPEHEISVTEENSPVVNENESDEPESVPVISISDDIEEDDSIAEDGNKVEDEGEQEPKETNEPTGIEEIPTIPLPEVPLSHSTAEAEQQSTAESTSQPEEAPSTPSENEQQVVIVPIPLPTPKETETQVAPTEATSEETDDVSLATEEPSPETHDNVSSPCLPPTPNPSVLASAIPQESTTEEADAEEEESEQEIPYDSLDSIAAIDTQQGMQYLVSQKAMRKLKRWKTISIILFVLLLALSSFTLSHLPQIFTSYKADPAPCIDITPTEDDMNTYAADSSTTDNQNTTDTTDVNLITPANVDSIINKKRTANKAEGVADKTVAAATPTSREENRQTAKQASLPQVNRGSYKITGMRSTHVVSRGETLTSIAEREYGSKAFAAYIATYNGLKDANYVHAGTTLRLPELQPK